jgi:hypothetical protein
MENSRLGEAAPTPVNVTVGKRRRAAECKGNHHWLRRYARGSVRPGDR